MVSSAMNRAIQTALPLAQELGQRVHVHAKLHETGMGARCPVRVLRRCLRSSESCTCWSLNSLVAPPVCLCHPATAAPYPGMLELQNMLVANGQDKMWTSAVRRQSGRVRQALHTCWLTCRLTASTNCKSASRAAMLVTRFVAWRRTAAGAGGINPLCSLTTRAPCRQILRRATAAAT